MQNGETISKSSTTTVSPTDAASGANVIVINLGSRYLKVGLAKDAFPRTYPMVIAHRNMDGKAVQKYPRRLSSDVDAALQERLSARAKSSNLQRKRPIPPNFYPSLIAFNRSVEPQQILAHNDAFGFEWTNTTTDTRAYYTGRDALRIDPEDVNYRLFYPIIDGLFNQESYTSARNVVGDIESIWRGAIQSELGLDKADLGRFACLLVIGDRLLMDDARVAEMLAEAALVYSGFKAVSVLAESTGILYGMGASTGVVVDLGAQKCSVVCVEDGLSISSSQVYLPIGGDDLAALFVRMLRTHGLAYPIDPDRGTLDWELARELTEVALTLDEDDLSLQVYECCVREPSKPTLLYPFKVLEERIIPPLGLFEPNLPLFQHRRMTVDAKRTDSFWSRLPNAIENAEESESLDETIAPAATNFVCKWRECRETFPNTLQDWLQHVTDRHCNSQTLTACEWDGCGWRPSNLYDKASWSCHLSGHLTNLQTRKTCRTPHEPTASSSLVALDDAIIESIAKGANGSVERAKRFLGNIILVGGMQQIPGFGPHLVGVLRNRLYNDPSLLRLQTPSGAAEEEMAQPTSDHPGSESSGIIVTNDLAINGIYASVDLVPNQRDLDPRFVAWKGGAVAARLECQAECWVGLEEWLSYGHDFIIQDRFAINI